MVFRRLVGLKENCLKIPPLSISIISKMIYEPVVKKDFFGRIIKTTSPVGKSGDIIIKNDIWYCYKEGYSNAVRKKIKISELK